jgi:hypothetical protein
MPLQQCFDSDSDSDSESENCGSGSGFGFGFGRIGFGKSDLGSFGLENGGSWRLFCAYDCVCMCVCLCVRVGLCV